MSEPGSLAPREVGTELAKELARRLRKEAEADPDLNPTAAIIAAADRLVAHAAIEVSVSPPRTVPWKPPDDPASRSRGERSADALVAFVDASLRDVVKREALSGAAHYLWKLTEAARSPPVKGYGTDGDFN